MSSLWTPGGEHPIDPERGDQPTAPPGEDTDPLAGLSPEEREQAEAMAQEMAAARQRVLEAPPDMVVANHVMGLYELAAIHLSDPDGDLDAARLAIDAMRALVEALGERLGEAAPTLRDALSQVQMAFVQVREQREGAEGGGGEARGEAEA